MTTLSAAIAITPRNRRFGLQAPRTLAWNGGSVARTIAFNAMSVTFPEGERFFMDSVRAFQKEVTDPRLAAQVRGFVTQEAIHSREHNDYNAALETAGLKLAPLFARQNAEIAESRERLNPAQQLAVTCGLEHLTAILADQLLSDPAYLEKAEPKFRALWLWHAVEEAEHKSVAFDVFRQVVPAKRQYRMRSVLMVMSFYRFLRHLHKNMASMLRDMGREHDWRLKLEIANYLWGRPGLLRRMVFPLLGYFKPGFHPWSHDNRDQIAQTERELAAAA